MGSENPIGALRSAERLAKRSGLTVSPGDVDVLARRGASLSPRVFEKKNRSYDLYAPAQLDRLVDAPVWLLRSNIEPV